MHSPPEYRGDPFARWHRGLLGEPHPGPACPAFDIDLVEWAFEGGRPLRPLALWEITRLGGQHERHKAKELVALRILSAHLCIPAFLVEVNDAATRFIVEAATEGWQREMDRMMMARFIERLRP